MSNTGIIEDHTKLPLDDQGNISLFPLTVIEVGKLSFHHQSKQDLRVLSLKQGGASYDGPMRLWPARWDHISHFYIIEPARTGFYFAKGLHCNFHYQVLPCELNIIESIIEFFRKN